MDLYTFSKSSWHVKLFKFLWGYDPVYAYKTMCPYFWKGILGIIISPILLIRRIIIIIGNKLISIDEARQKRIKDKKVAEALKAFNELTSYTFEDVRDFLLKYNYINYEIACAVINIKYKDIDDDYEIKHLFWTAEDDIIEEIDLNCSRKKRKLKEEREIKIAKIKAKIDTIRYNPIVSKVLAVIAGIIGLILIGGLLVGLYYLIITYYKNILAIILILLILAIAAGIIYLIAMFVQFLIGLLPNKERECIRFPWLNTIGASIITMFKGIRHGFTVVIGMIYNLYKSQCPIITWKDNE